MVPKCPKMVLNGTKMVPKWSQNYLKMVQKWLQNCPKMVLKWSHSYAKRSQNGSKLVLKLSQNSPKIFRVIDLDVISLNSEFEPCSSLNSWDKLLVQFLATMEAVAPLANDPIMLGRSIRLFRHLKHQTMSTSDEFIHSSEQTF